MVCRCCPKVQSWFCSGSDMLHHNRDKHHNKVQAAAGMKQPIAVVEEAAVTLPPFPDVVLTVTSPVSSVIGEPSIANEPFSEYISLSLFSKRLLLEDLNVLQGLDKESLLLMEGILGDTSTSFSSFPTCAGDDVVDTEALNNVTAQLLGLHHPTPSSGLASSSLSPLNDNATSSLLLLASEGTHPLPLSPPLYNVTVLPNVYEILPCDADAKVVPNQSPYQI